MIKSVGPTAPNRIEAMISRGAEQSAAPEQSAATGPKASVREAQPTLIGELIANGPPVDAERVASLRTAIAEGRYAVNPGAIADAMIRYDLGAKFAE